MHSTTSCLVSRVYLDSTLPLVRYAAVLLGIFCTVRTMKVKLAHTRIIESNTQRRVPEPIPVFGSQPASDVSHKPGGRQPLLSARPAVTLATLKRAATNFAAW